MRQTLPKRHSKHSRRRRPDLSRSVALSMLITILSPRTLRSIAARDLPLVFLFGKEREPKQESHPPRLPLWLGYCSCLALSTAHHHENREGFLKRVVEQSPRT